MIKIIISDIEYVSTGVFDKWSRLPVYEITKDFKVITKTGTILIPKGTLTDFASLPWPVRNWFKPHDKRWDKAALLHDVLCSNKSVKRFQADRYFLQAMRQLGAGWIAYLFFISVFAYSISGIYKK